MHPFGNQLLFVCLASHPKPLLPCVKPFAVGDRIFARWQGSFYPGLVEAVVET
jgi:hypothetical protein